MGRNPRGYWNFERCKEEGQKYSSRHEWKRNSQSSYKAALRDGWVDQIIPESRRTVPNGHWDDFENCKAEGQKYSSRHEWQVNSKGSYDGAWRNGWLELIIPESRHTVSPGHWNDFENCKAEGQKYSSRGEWQFSSRGSYKGARRNGWISQIIPETADSTTDNDAVYLYEFEYAGVRLHKIGLTSIRRNTGRIEETMRGAGCTAENVIFWHVEDARDIERKMLEVGQPQDLYKGDGFTEMRILTPQEQRRVMRIAGDACISDPVYIERVP